MNPFWPGVFGMAILGLIGVALLYAAFTYDHVAPAVPIVGMIWTPVAFGAAIYFAFSR